MNKRIRRVFYLSVVVGLSIPLQFLSAKNAEAQTSPPLTSTMADVDLSTVRVASLTHWKTFYTTDPQVLRAQFQADKSQAHTLDLVVDSWISSNQYNLALINRFGEAAYTAGGLPNPPDRKLFESIQWKTVGDRAIPVDPPKVTGERCMVKIGGHWLMPLSELYFTDERRLKELEFSIKLNHQMTLNVSTAKDLQAATQPSGIPDQPSQPDLSLSEGIFPVPPLLLPDTNDTFPEGALAAWALAVFNGDGKAVEDLSSVSTAEQSAFFKKLVDLINISGQMCRAADMKFDHASEKFKYALILKSQTAFVLQNIYFSSKTILGSDKKSATITVHSPDDGAINSGPSGLSVEFKLLMNDDVWRVSNPEDLVSIPGSDPRAKPDLKLKLELFTQIASDEKKLTADIKAGKFASLDDLITQSNSRLVASLNELAVKHR